MRNKKQVIFLAIALLISNAVIGQSKYMEREENDADKLFKICRLIFDEQKFDEALLMLDPILKNVPENCAKIYAEQRRFWDEQEYNEYIEHVNDASIPFIPDAYTKVYYLYAVINIERGNWQKAEEYLLSGLKQVPDNPHLLCEMGMLCQSRYISTLKNEYLKASFAYFSQVLENDSFCSSRMFARALRGIGFNLIEVGDLDTAEKFFTSSLTYDDNAIAHEELAYIEKIRKKENPQQPTTVMSNTNSDVDICSYEFLYEQLNKLPKELDEVATANRYAYIFSKAALLLKIGIEEYRNQDYFKYPLRRWNGEKIIYGCKQIVYHTRGLSPDLCLEDMTEEEFKNLFKIFHFEASKMETVTNDGVLKGYFTHIVDDGDIVMYCRVLKE